MVTKIYYLIVFYFIIFISQLTAQNCTITCSGGSPCTIDWDNMVCDETGSFPAVGDEIIITNGVTVEVTDNDEEFNGNLRIQSGGILTFPSSSDKLDLTNGSSGCGNYILIENGGKITGGSASNQLSICGQTIGKGGGGCTSNDPPSAGDSPPYCLNGDGLNGEVALDENGVNPGLLPIELYSFSGKQISGKIQLNWETGSEINFSHFDLQQSTDGYNFISLANIEGKNQLTGRNKYSFEHTNPSLGNNYYRLKNVDIDSSFSYSKVVVVSLMTRQTIEIYPTYNNKGGQVYVNFAQVEAKAEVLFYSLSGKLIYSQSLENVSRGPIQITPETKLMPNHYIIEVKSGNRKFTMPIIVVE
ncbi:hypothetical protein [Flexithrix dorotheae]|uniref:hypothetical protein n=1 Tax=Flexithrix dorotheae TaxID=70993 RepID=UPI000368EAA1|nr:hypothetical protein [Flexithrix dorotheae]